ncbi:DUF3558 family protein [Streptomyces sp. MD20-1-1]|uniref:DUF3558 family protein n=1 Tax=Streptomyces sp. MD20-1-1 TaxID=3028668 RepID=UPI0010C132A8|nr:DUF3558 family protein [Streptomyces sp. MD20-1-1]WSB85917.1 DUF3558 family protein [Streptomyces cellulosae]WTC17318.1 DUF3558 family protein [Streptomyces cellulosae]
MSEGTMQRRAQREQPERAKRLTRVLVCAAAVPVMLVATGCSSDSGSDDGGDKAASASASASPSPTVQAAAYRTLPEACGVLSEKTLKDLAPKAKSGKEGSSDDVAARASCSWSSLDNNGVKGSQFRWLNVSLLRFESDTTRGPGDKLAKEYYDKQVRDVRATPGAKGLNAQAVAGTGDEATAVRYDLKKKEGTFKQQTVVARVENVVVTLDYNGAGLAGDKTPDAAALLSDAKKAAREAVLSVTRANGPSAASGSPSAPTSGRPSASASEAPSASASGKS